MRRARRRVLRGVEQGLLRVGLVGGVDAGAHPAEQDRDDDDPDADDGKAVLREDADELNRQPAAERLLSFAACGLRLSAVDLGSWVGLEPGSYCHVSLLRIPYPR